MAKQIDNTIQTPFEIFDGGGEEKEFLFKKLGLRHFGKLTISLYVSYALIFGSVIGGITFLYAAFISKLTPETGIWLFDAMKQDFYFCYLIPLMILPTTVSVYLNWLAMKFFEAH